MNKILLIAVSFMFLFLSQIQAQSKKIFDVTVAINTSITASIDIGTGGRYLSGIRFPSGWTGVEVTLQDSWDGTNFQNVYWGDGSEVSFTIAAGRSVKMFPWDVLSLGPYIKIRSGNSTTPVNQVAEKTLTIETSEFK